MGKTGTGKSTMLEKLMVRDIAQGNGFACIDPHGTHAHALLDYIPPERLHDVLYCNVSVRDSPVAFTPLAHVPPDDRPLVTDALVSSCKHIWKHAWGEGRMEQRIYNTIAALLDTEGATLLGVRRRLVREEYRKQVRARVRDPEVRTYWREDVGTWASRSRREAIAPVLHTVGPLFPSPLTRTLLGQRESACDLVALMDERRLLIAPLSQGTVGHPPAKLRGSLRLSPFPLSALRRAPRSADHPACNRDMDELTNFATDGFSAIFSECRQYGLARTLAHPSIAPMRAETRAAVLGNVGTRAVGRVGQRDAAVVEKALSHAIPANTMVAQDNHRICRRLLDQGPRAPRFQAAPLPKPPPHPLQAEDVLAASRRCDGSPREEGERAIDERWAPSFLLAFDE